MTNQAYYEQHRDGLIVSLPEVVIHPGLGSNGHALIEMKTELVWHDHKRYVVVETPFWFDGASIPNAVFPILDVNALDMVFPGGGHDACYRIDFQYLDLRSGMMKTPDRHDADKVLSKMSANVGADWDDRKKIFYGVRAGGHGSYHQKTMNWRPE